MKDGFLKAAALSPSLRVADCNYNASQIVSQLQDAAARGVRLAVFPEFCLTGYTCGDLFLQRTLQQGALDALQTVLDASRELDVVALVGLPLLVRGKLYNCAAVLCGGRLLGLVPKTYLPNYGEFYEKRQFTPGSTEVENVTVCGQEVPFGTSLLFRCRQMPSFVLGVEICEDLWSALPPSTFHTLAGATVIANLSASDETVGKAEYRRALVSNQSARLLCGYLYASAGHGESTQDMVFAGHDLIAENGALLAETSPFEGGWAETELDCQRMESERARNTSFEPSAEGYLTVDFDLALTETKLSRWVDPTPFIPHDERRRAERCELILKMQADGLAKRLEHAHAKTAVIGISGGLDSCLALLVAVRANCWEWYTSVVRTRMHNASRELVVFTRWHEEDLIGALAVREPVEELRAWSQLDTLPADRWLHLNFEALKTAPPTEVDPRQPGEALWERQHGAALLEAKRRLDPLQFEAMYQGRPSAREGLLYGLNFAEYDCLPHEIVRRANYTDTADTGDDYLCSLSYAVDADGVVYITDAVYSREPMEVTEPLVAGMLLRSDTRQAAIESNNGGRGFARSVQALAPSVRIEWFHQGANKEARILSNSATALHLVRFPRGWNLRWPELYAHLTTYRRRFRANRWHDAADVVTGIVEREAPGRNRARVRGVRFL